MLEDDIAAIFREQELQRRLRRHEALMRNEAALAKELLNERDQKAHTRAVESLKEYHHKLDKEIHHGYWQRLWNALLNR